MSEQIIVGSFGGREARSQRVQDQEQTQQVFQVAFQTEITPGEFLFITLGFPAGMMRELIPQAQEWLDKYDEGLLS